MAEINFAMPTTAQMEDSLFMPLELPLEAIQNEPPQSPTPVLTPSGMGCQDDDEQAHKLAEHDTLLDNNMDDEDFHADLRSKDELILDFKSTTDSLEERNARICALELELKERDALIADLRSRNSSLEDRNARLSAALDEHIQLEADAHADVGIRVDDDDRTRDGAQDDGERAESLGGYRASKSEDNANWSRRTFVADGDDGSTSRYVSVLGQQHISAGFRCTPADTLIARSAKRRRSSSADFDYSSSVDNEETPGRLFVDSTPAKIKKYAELHQSKSNGSVASPPSHYFRTAIERPGFGLKSKFIFEALIGFSSLNQPTLIGIHDLPDGVILSISETMDTIASGVYGKQKQPIASQPTMVPGKLCAFAWLARKGRKYTSWTVDKPGDFACSACAKECRACLRWVRSGVWRLLPLPAAVREKDHDPSHEEFWIKRLHPDQFGQSNDGCIWDQVKKQPSGWAKKRAKAEPA